MNTKKEKPKGRGVRSLAATLAVAFIGISALALLSSSALQMVLNVRSQQAEIASNQQRIAQDASKTVSSFLQEKFGALETALEYANPVLVDSVTRKNILESLLGLDPAFRQFALLDRQGRQLGQTTRVSQALTPQFILQFNGDLLSQTVNGQRYFSPVYIDDTTGEPLVVIAVPVTNILGDYQGTLAAEVNLKFMWDLVDQLKIGETGYVYVVDNQGNLIAFQDTSRVLAGENVTQIGVVSGFVNNPSASSDVTPGTVSYQGLLGTTVLGTYVPLGTPEWAVVAEIPSAEAYRPIYQSIAVSVGIILVMAILAGLAGIIISRRLAVPLVDLTGTATRIAEGEIQLQAAVGGVQEVATLATAFNTMTSQLRDLIGSLERRVADRTKALATSTEVSRRLSTILDRHQLVTEVVEQVRTSFNYYHAQIYLLDEMDNELVMAGGTGQAGRAMLERGHKIPKGKGLVGRAAESNTPVLVPETSSDPNWLPNPLLPETKSEVAVPISIGSQVLGVLDVQHNIIGGLQQEDANLLYSIANQVAVALQNIQQYEGTQKIAADMGVVANVGIATSTITDPQHLLQEVVDLSKESFKLYHAHIYLLNKTGDSLELTAGAGEVGRQMVSEKHSIPLDSEQSLVARAARTRNGVMINDVNDAPDFLPNPLLPNTRSEMAVPMLAGGRVVGVLDVQSETVNHFTDVDVNIQATLASQVAVALQNALSFTQIQKQAKHESTMNLITQKIQGAGTIETALQIAVRELGHALGQKPTTISLDLSVLADEHKGND